jgi:hypothetical protein
MGAEASGQRLPLAHRHAPPGDRAFRIGRGDGTECILSLLIPEGMQHGRGASELRLESNCAPPPDGALHSIRALRFYSSV